MYSLMKKQEYYGQVIIAFEIQKMIVLNKINMQTIIFKNRQEE